MKKRYAQITLVLLLLFMYQLSAVAYGAEKIRITASFYPIASFASFIGADLITVRTIVPTAVEPHDYEPSPKEIAAVMKSQVFIYNGSGMEPWAEKMKDEFAKKKVLVIELSEKIDLIEAGPDDHDEHDAHSKNDDHHHSDTDHHGHEDHSFAHDPHFWVDPISAIAIAETIRDAFIKADPANEKAYADNAAKLIGKLHDLDTAFQAGLKNCKHNYIVAQHNAFAYLARRYNLEVLPLAGITPTSEPTSSKLAHILARMKEKGIDVVFYEPLVNTKLAKMVAKESAARLLPLDPIEMLPKGETYFTTMEKNLNSLKEGLKCGK